MRYGLVVGKFSPLHAGHEYLIREAKKRCDKLLIVSYSLPEYEGCHAAVRKRWLETRFPDIQSVVLEPQAFMGMPRNDDPDKPQQNFFCYLIKNWLNYPVDVIFCSEPWGEPCAKLLSIKLGREVKAEIIDVDRKLVPISGTAIRENPGKYHHYLSPEVNNTFVRRIVLLGGESTGKSTLAAALAQKHNTLWVSEYGRELWERQNGQLNQDDLVRIAYEQISREHILGRSANRYLFCDTSPLTTLGYSFWMFGRAHDKLQDLAERQYHGVIFCHDDYPFVSDGTRRDAGFRCEQQVWYVNEISAMDVPVLEVHGDVASRVAQVSRWLETAAI
jgi:HTH-type transcriptional regulator, transcriptional repressor of NAD biosynthesis genes